MFQAQKLIADTQVASARFTDLPVRVSDVAAVFTFSANHRMANSFGLWRKLLRQKRSRFTPRRTADSPGLRQP